MKSVKRILSILSALLLGLTTLSAGSVFTFAATVPAGADTYINGEIRLMDELGNWWVSGSDPQVRINNGHGDYVLYQSPDNPEYNGPYADFKGTTGISGNTTMSYDRKTNTITIKDFSLNGTQFGKAMKNFSWGLMISDMKNLTLNVVGTNELTFIQLYNTNLTIKGTGSLTLNPGLHFIDAVENGKYIEKTNEHIGLFIPIDCSEGSVTINNDVTVKILPDPDDYWNVYDPESYSWGIMKFSFAKKKTDNSFFSFKGNCSETPTWKNLGGKFIKQLDPKYDQTNLIYHKFPAGKICALEGYSGTDNYWIPSVIGENRGTIYTKLKKTDDGWFEDADSGICKLDYDGQWYPLITYAYDGIFNSWNPDRDHPIDPEPVFTPYTDFSNMPADLVSDGNAEAFVYMQVYQNFRPVYTKDGHEYQMLDVYGASENSKYYYSPFLEAVDPEAPENGEYSRVMLLKNETAKNAWLTYGEKISDTSNSTEFYNQDADALAKEAGYTPAIVDHSYTSAYDYYVVNRKGLTFTPSKGKLSECQISGITKKTYTGKPQTQNLKVTYKGAALTKNTDYTVAYKNNTNAGTASVILTGKGKYTGSVTKTFSIAKANNAFKKATLNKTLSAAKGKKKKQTFQIAASFAFKAAPKYAATKFVTAKAKKYISVSKKGVVTVKKQTPKGTYKIKVKIQAPATKNVKAKTVTKTVKIVIK